MQCFLNYILVEINRFPQVYTGFFEYTLDCIYIYRFLQVYYGLDTLVGSGIHWFVQLYIGLNTSIYLSLSTNIGSCSVIKTNQWRRSRDGDETHQSLPEWVGHLAI